MLTADERAPASTCSTPRETRSSGIRRLLKSLPTPACGRIALLWRRAATASFGHDAPHAGGTQEWAYTSYYYYFKYRFVLTTL